VDAVFEFKEYNADLMVFDDYITLTPKGVGGFLTRGLQGEKRIPISSITAVQIKEAGFTTGYIQFSILGGNEGRGGALEAVYDENSFMFGGFMDGQNDQKNKLAQDIKVFIEDRMASKAKSGQTTSQSISEEIRNLKELLDAGAITEEEFVRAKGKLFG